MKSHIPMALAAQIEMSRSYEKRVPIPGAIFAWSSWLSKSNSEGPEVYFKALHLGFLFKFRDERQ